MDVYILSQFSSFLTFFRFPFIDLAGCVFFISFVGRATKNLGACDFGCEWHSVHGPPCDIDPDSEHHEDYLSEFKSMLVTKMRNFIDKDLANDPDCIKGRKKTVQVRQQQKKARRRHSIFL